MYQATLETNAPDYYESVRGLKGEELKDALHDLIDGHTIFSYNSSRPSLMLTLMQSWADTL